MTFTEGNHRYMKKHFPDLIWIQKLGRYTCNKCMRSFYNTNPECLIVLHAMIDANSDIHGYLKSKGFVPQSHRWPRGDKYIIYWSYHLRKQIKLYYNKLPSLEALKHRISKFVKIEKNRIN